MIPDRISNQINHIKIYQNFYPCPRLKVILDELSTQIRADSISPALKNQYQSELSSLQQVLATKVQAQQGQINNQSAQNYEKFESNRKRLLSQIPTLDLNKLPNYMNSFNTAQIKMAQAGTPIPLQENLEVWILCLTRLSKTDPYLATATDQVNFLLDQMYNSFTSQLQNRTITPEAAMQAFETISNQLPQNSPLQKKCQELSAQFKPQEVAEHKGSIHSSYEYKPLISNTEDPVEFRREISQRIPHYLNSVNSENLPAFKEEVKEFRTRVSHLAKRDPSLKDWANQEILPALKDKHTTLTDPFLQKIERAHSFNDLDQLDKEYYTLLSATIPDPRLETIGAALTKKRDEFQFLTRINSISSLDQINEELYEIPSDETRKTEIAINKLADILLPMTNQGSPNSAEALTAIEMFQELLSRYAPDKLSQIQSHLQRYHRADTHDPSDILLKRIDQAKSLEDLKNIDVSYSSMLTQPTLNPELERIESALLEKRDSLEFLDRVSKATSLEQISEELLSTNEPHKIEIATKKLADILLSMVEQGASIPAEVLSTIEMFRDQLSLYTSDKLSQIESKTQPLLTAEQIREKAGIQEKAKQLLLMTTTLQKNNPYETYRIIQHCLREIAQHHQLLSLYAPSEFAIINKNLQTHQLNRKEIDLLLQRGQATSKELFALQADSETQKFATKKSTSVPFSYVNDDDIYQEQLSLKENLDSLKQDSTGKFLELMNEQKTQIEALQKSPILVDISFESWDAAINDGLLTSYTNLCHSLETDIWPPAEKQSKIKLLEQWRPFLLKIDENLIQIPTVTKSITNSILNILEIDGNDLLTSITHHKGFINVTKEDLPFLRDQLSSSRDLDLQLMLWDPDEDSACYALQLYFTYLQTTQSIEPVNHFSGPNFVHPKKTLLRLEESIDQAQTRTTLKQLRADYHIQSMQPIQGDGSCYYRGVIRSIFEQVDTLSRDQKSDAKQYLKRVFEQNQCGAERFPLLHEYLNNLDKECFSLFTNQAFDDEVIQSIKIVTANQTENPEEKVSILTSKKDAEGNFVETALLPRAFGCNCIIHGAEGFKSKGPPPDSNPFHITVDLFLRHNHYDVLYK